MRGVRISSHKEKRCDDSDRLLRIIGAMAQRQSARHHALPDAYRPRTQLVRGLQTTRRSVHDEAREEAEDGGQCEHAHDAQCANRLDPVKPSPVHRTGPALSEPRRRPNRRAVHGPNSTGVPATK